MLDRDFKYGTILLMIILIFIPSSIEIRAKFSTFVQQEDDWDQLIPSTTTQTAQIPSNSMLLQEEVVKYLIDNWDVYEILENDLINAIEIICQAATAVPSVQITSQITNKILTDFNLILATNLSNSKETLNRTAEGLYYISKDGDKEVTTNMNLWIVKALLTLGPSRIEFSVEMASDIMKSLELHVHGQPPAEFLHSFILLDPTDNPIPGSISPIILLQDQLMALTIYQQLSYNIFDDQVLEYSNRIMDLENLTLNDKGGFLDYNLSSILELNLGFLHAERDQKLGRFHYQNNISSFYFRDILYLLEYYFNQIKDFSTEADRKIYDSSFYDPILANSYQNKLIRLLTDLQVLFRYKDIFYYNKMKTYNYNTTLPIYPGDRIYISDQFAFIKLLSRMANWYSLTILSNDFQAFGKQLQRLIILLWDFLEIEAYNPSTGGRAANSGNFSSGYFFAFYSVSLGLYLFDNTSQGSLLKANIFALNGLGVLFPFQLILKYNTPVTVRDNQSLFFHIIPLMNGNSSGLYINNELWLSVPAESLNTIIATPTITAQTNYSTRYNFSISQEGPIALSIHLSHQNVDFFNLDASYLVLRSLMMDVLLDPVTPTQGDKLTIYFEIRDEVGLLRDHVYYFVEINSKSFEKPLSFFNQSLYSATRLNPIILNSSYTQSDLSCYFLVYKDNYYPAEANMTIHFSTKPNFLVEWLIWLILESDLGAWMGTIAAISAILWGLYISFINRLLRRVKTCQYCGSSWRTKYPVCAHCGRVLNPKKLKNDSPQTKILEEEQGELPSKTEI